MKYKEDVRHQLDKKAKATIICGIIMAFLVIMVPLWQKGSASALSFRTVAAEEKINSLDKEERVLLSSISTVDKSIYRSEVTLALADN
ncbi:MAG: hypothetical protein ACI4S4_05595 [Candidatus Ornithospirochaeta sp.]